MNTRIIPALLGALLFSGVAEAAPSIYPVDTARFLGGSRFDFKVEFDGELAEKDAKVLINGQDAKAVLGAEPEFIAKEKGADASALLLRGASLKPGQYKVTVESPTGKASANWDVYGTPDKPVAKNVILLIADGLSMGHRTSARLMSKGVTNGMYNGKLAECFYSASNGGQTELVENVWSGSGDYGYYAMVDDPYDLENPQSIVRTMKISKNGTVKEALRTLIYEQMLPVLTREGYATDEENFRIDFKDLGNDRWSLVLTPTTTPLDKIFASLELGGATFLESIVLNDKQGDRTVIALSRHQLTPASLTDAERQRFAAP